MSTKQLADLIVSGLEAALRHASLPSIRSIYIYGSYCRGDWLDCSSDLDVGVITSETDDSGAERDILWLRDTLDRLKGEAFPSHCPGGIDLSRSPESAVPRTLEEAAIPAPYAPFSTTLFDLRAHHLSLYGEELDHILPPAPSPSGAAGDWLAALDTRAASLGTSDPRLMFLAYKAITAAQLHFGRPTLHKYRILELYQSYVPNFEEKTFGERVIRNYLGSFYPGRPPVPLPGTECCKLIHQLRMLKDRP